MYKLKIFDVSRWKKEVHIHTSGTRNKHILTSPKNEKYFFKKSLQKPNKDYKYEFWSEVIASQIGDILGFDVVKYHVAYFGNEIGCISKSIVNTNEEELSEGYGHVVEVFPDFQYSYKKTHSFQKITGALRNLKLDFLTPKIIQLIIFDAIIGNTDRHSENWAIVVSNISVKNAIKQFECLPFGKKITVRLFLFLRSKGKLSYSKIFKYVRERIYSLSPLYDNGSSLARELSESKIEELLGDIEKFDSFIYKGKPDIRWNDVHLNHFDLINTIKLDYPNEVKDVLDKIKSRYNKNVLHGIVNNIDKKLPLQFSNYKLPNKRKEFIVKYIDYRISIILNRNEPI